MTVSTFDSSVSETFFMEGVPFWNAFCGCKEHKQIGWKRIDKKQVWQLAHLVNANPFTEEGTKTLNHILLTVEAVLETKAGN